MSVFSNGYGNLLIYSSSYELTRNPEILKKLQEEIDEAFQDEDFEDTIDFNRVQQMPYLEKCVLEAVRLYSPVGFTSRACVKDYT